jgi:hypothetical protein
MSLLNIVIHILFASIGLLSVEREVEDKITIWYQQEKSFNEYRNKFHVNYWRADLRIYLIFIRTINGRLPYPEYDYHD